MEFYNSDFCLLDIFYGDLGSLHFLRTYPVGVQLDESLDVALPLEGAQEEQVVATFEAASDATRVARVALRLAGHPTRAQSNHRAHDLTVLFDIPLQHLQQQNIH